MVVLLIIFSATLDLVCSHGIRQHSARICIRDVHMKIASCLGDQTMRRQDSKKQICPSAFWLLRFMTEIILLMSDDSWIMGWIDLSNDRFGDFATDVWSRTENAIELQQGSQYQIQTEFSHEPPWINKARDGYAHSISRDRNPKFQFSFIGSLQMCLNPLTGKRRGRRTKLNHPTSWNNHTNIFFSAPCLAVHK